MFFRRHWIPPGALAFAQLAQGASWILLAIAAAAGAVDSLTPQAVAWIHTVALGWLTMAALGILMHVVPGFTDVVWRGERIVRGTLVPFGAGIALFVAGWLTRLTLVAAGGVLIFLAFAVYYAIAVRTLAAAKHNEPTERAIARALTINLTMLLVAVTLGGLMAVALVIPQLGGMLVRTPAIHANFALYGWLTMLVFGVSARTVRPICGARSRFSWIHIITGTSMLIAPFIVAAGVGFGLTPLTWIGAALAGAGTLFYAFDIADVLRRATVNHRPPQAFIGAALVWLVLSSVLGGAALAGAPCWNAFVFVILLGWIGQMVNAHFFHIGIRLLATIYRGDDDETRPSELLDARLSWLCFGASQLAVLLCTGGLLLNVSAAVIAGAACGFAAWLVFLANVRAAITNLKTLPIQLFTR